MMKASRRRENMVKGLTKQDLINWGISVEKTEDGYRVFRTGKPHGFAKTDVTREVPIHNIYAKHKYGKEKGYPSICFSVNNKPKGFALSRVVYAWFIGDIPDNYDIDHIDNNPYNNSLENLQLLTRKENIAKRGPARNQHNAKWSNADIELYRCFKNQIMSLTKAKKEADDKFLKKYYGERINLCKELMKQISDRYN